MGTSMSVTQVRSEFFTAIQKGEVADVLTLLERYGESHHLLKVCRADPARKNVVDTALGLAAREQHVEIVEVLLENSANPNFMGIHDRTGDASANVMAPLHHAARTGNVEIMKLLLDYDADVNVQVKGRLARTLDTPLMLACGAGISTAVAAETGEGRLGAVQCLLSRKDLNVNQQNYVDKDALMFAAEFADDSVLPSVDILRALLATPGINLEAQSEKRSSADHRPKTALMWCKNPTARALIRRAINPDTPLSRGSTPGPPPEANKDVSGRLRGDSDVSLESVESVDTTDVVYVEEGTLRPRTKTV